MKYSKITIRSGFPYKNMKILLWRKFFHGMMHQVFKLALQQIPKYLLMTGGLFKHAFINISLSTFHKQLCRKYSIFITNTTHFTKNQTIGNNHYTWLVFILSFYHLSLQLLLYSGVKDITPQQFAYKCILNQIWDKTCSFMRLYFITLLLITWKFPL